MSSFNKVILLGNLTRDPQVRQLPGNSVVTDFGLACNRKFRTAAGEDREETAFVDCSAFGKQAEVISQFCRKGKPLFVEGRLKYDTWDDKAGGGKRSKLSVVVENFQFVGPRESDVFESPAPRSLERTGDLFPKEKAWRDREPQPAASPTADAPRRGRRKNAGQPFGEEKQFAEADIPF
jgi:single-strand DNA-binding protein